MDSDRLIPKSIEMIVSRSLKGGGFAQRQNGEFRPDVTAWSIIALTTGNIYRDLVENSCNRLAASQLNDGRIPVAEDLDNVYWPTALAVLAWKSTGGFENEIKRATKFLVKTSGLHFPREKDSPTGHDTAIRGWPWIAKAHSWIEPTSMAILALKATGNAGHDRVQEAVRMILDRKLPAGGWNYGNTVVFNQELSPTPEHTGQALCALSGFVHHSEIAKSIDYLGKEISILKTPISLCWGLFGLMAWAVKIKDNRERILNSLSLQQRYGHYDTSLLSKLVIAYNTEGNLSGFIMPS
ncbi:MAG: terpene cyclase/mutase family protein [Proteobacteria bacterium]|nr:terpene cyclase/mutase family protein [Pseudomonadota bacterium]